MKLKFDDNLKDKSKNDIMKMPLMFPVQFAEGKIPTEIHVIPIGEWDHDAYGKIVITKDDIEQFIDNFDKGVRKGVPITEGHETLDEKPAIGWFKSLKSKKDGLWATVEWTDRGKDLLKEKAYKYFSPEFYRVYEDPETHQIYTNVLVGGALTNKPYFKGLKAIVFNEPNIVNQLSNTTMNLNEIRKKKASELTDEEKSFLRTQMSEGKLTVTDLKKFAEALSDEKGEEEKPEEKPEDKPEEGKEEEGKEGEEKVEGSEVKISAAELKVLQDKADQGAQAMSELTETKIANQVNSMVFSESNKSGKILPKQKQNVTDFMKTLTEKQRASFSEIISALPTVQMFKEVGEDGGESDDSVSKQVESKISEKMKADDSLKYSDAARLVFRENPELAKQYNAERGE